MNASGGGTAPVGAVSGANAHPPPYGVQQGEVKPVARSRVVMRYNGARKRVRPDGGAFPPALRKVRRVMRQAELDKSTRDEGGPAEAECPEELEAPDDACFVELKRRVVRELRRSQAEGRHQLGEQVKTMNLSKLGFGERLKYEHGRGAARGKLFPVDALSDFRQTLVMNLFVRGFCFENQTTSYPYDASTAPLLEAIDCGRLTPDLVDLFEDISCYFYEGALLVLLRDYRSCTSYSAAPVERRVVLQPDHETLICDIEDLCQKLSPDLSPELRLSIEQKILRRTQFKALCLDPSPKVALAVNTLSCRRNAMLRLAARRSAVVSAPKRSAASGRGPPVAAFPFPDALKSAAEEKPVEIDKFAVLQFLQRRNSLPAYASKMAAPNATASGASSASLSATMPTSAPLSASTGSAPVSHQGASAQRASMTASTGGQRPSPSKRGSGSGSGSNIPSMIPQNAGSSPSVGPPKLTCSPGLHYLPQTSIVLKKRVLKFQQSNGVRKYIVLEVEPDSPSAPQRNGATNGAPAAPGTPGTPGTPGGVSGSSSLDSSNGVPQVGQPAPSTPEAARAQYGVSFTGGYRGTIRTGKPSEDASETFCFSFPLRSAEEVLKFIRFFTRQNELEGMLLAYDSAIAEQRQAQQQQQHAPSHVPRMHGAMPASSKAKLAARQVQPSDYLAMMRRTQAQGGYMAPNGAVYSQYLRQPYPMQQQATHAPGTSTLPPSSTGRGGPVSTAATAAKGAPYQGVPAQRGTQAHGQARYNGTYRPPSQSPTAGAATLGRMPISYGTTPNAAAVGGASQFSANGVTGGVGAGRSSGAAVYSAGMAQSYAAQGVSGGARTVSAGVAGAPQGVASATTLRSSASGTAPTTQPAPGRTAGVPTTAGVSYASIQGGSGQSAEQARVGYPSSHINTVTTRDS